MSGPMEEQFRKDCAAIDEQWETEAKPMLDALGFFDVDLTEEEE